MRYCEKKHSFAIQNRIPDILCPVLIKMNCFEQFSVGERVKMVQCLLACITLAMSGDGFDEYPDMPPSHFDV